MKKVTIFWIACIISSVFQTIAQTSYTGSIINPSFETGNGTGWTWTGVTGYSWIGPNTDGDATKDGSYINGLWNASIGDAQCSQTVTGLPAGNYKVTALVTVSTGRLTNQRLFATAGSTTKSMLFGAASNAAYSAANMAILGTTESYSFGGYSESSAENGPFYKLSVVAQVTNGSMTFGIRVSGKSTTLGYAFSNTTKTDAGFFKFDNFTLNEVSNVATLDNIILSSGSLNVQFNPATYTYTATLPEGVTSVTPTIVPTVEGASISGNGPVDVSSNSGTSVITVTALDGVTTKTYTINYKVLSATNVATLGNLTLSAGSLDVKFDPATYDYTATLPEGTTSVTPVVTPTVVGVTVSGTGAVDVSSGSGTSVITVTALDGITTKTYTINYKVIMPLAGTQQDRLYTNNFPLEDVTLLDGPFKHARDLNIQTLLKYDVDRLLAPYRKEAGLSANAISYDNWSGLDGHIGGHYLSSLAINYAATGDSACKRLMDYMVTQLKSCQDTNAVLNPAWGVGYAGGVPGSSAIWSTLKTGNFTAFNAAWVPWYNVHKTYAGLRDAWLYGGNETARTVFLAFCDWGINITSALTDAQMETMLTIEHGGMNEIFADAYQMTGIVKYLTAAKRFSHKVILNSMAASIDNLDNMHDNTQIPKAVGFQRIAEVSRDATYTKAAQFFWQTVTSNRSLSLGGSGRQEYFPQASAFNDYVNDAEGPETCASYNMLKLTEDLFRLSPQAKYADFYERALYNHILSSQHPENGGYVYFTPARPRHYRVYSAPNEAMWCCVGTGMENHGKYGQFIYTHQNDSLYLNLFIASQLNWKEKGIEIKQETIFPDEERTRLTITAASPTQFKLMIRHPAWVPAGAFKVIIGTDTLPDQSQPSSYVTVDRTWSGSEIITVLLPMHTTIEQLPNVSQYISIMHGPILLGAKTGTEDLLGLIADDSRWGHIASGTLLPLDQAPIIVGDKTAYPTKLIPVTGTPLTFSAPGLFVTKADSALVLEPFFRIHDSRYMMYWMALNKAQYKTVVDSLAIVQKAAQAFNARIVDQVAPGQQQPEVDHEMMATNSSTGNFQNEFWRDASAGGSISYSMVTQGLSNLSLMVRYWGNEVGSRSFYIKIDDALLTTENIVGKWNLNQFEDVEYPIPNSMSAGKDTITVKFQAINTSNYAGGLFYVWILKPAVATADPIVKANNSTCSVICVNRNIILSGLGKNATIYVYNTSGCVLKKVRSEASVVNIPVKTPGINIVKIIDENGTFVRKVIVT